MGTPASLDLPCRAEDSRGTATKAELSARAWGCCQRLGRGGGCDGAAIWLLGRDLASLGLCSLEVPRGRV